MLTTDEKTQGQRPAGERTLFIGNGAQNAAGWNSGGTGPAQGLFGRNGCIKSIENLTVCLKIKNNVLTVIEYAVSPNQNRHRGNSSFSSAVLFVGTGRGKEKCAVFP